MPIYTDVVAAAGETVEKMLAGRGGRVFVQVTTEGGRTASMVRTNSMSMTLNLPTMPPDARLTRQQADRFVGYLVHETAHMLHTDWSHWTAATRNGDLVKNLTNALEDLRIERLEQAGPWKGFGAAMASLINHMHSENPNPALVANNLPWIIAMVGRQVVNGLDITGAKALHAKVPAELRPALDYALAHAGKTVDCADCHYRAREIARLLHQAKQKAEAAPPPPPPAAPEQGDAKAAPDQAEAGQGDAKADQSEGEAAPDQAEAGQGEGEADQGDAKADQAPGKGGQAGAKAFDDGAAVQDPNVSAGTHAEAEDNNGYGDLPQRVMGKLTSHTRFDVQSDGVTYKGAAGRVRQAIPRSATLSDQVGQLVLSQEVRQRERRLTAGRFDRRGMARAGMGATDVYARRQVTPGVDTAVCLLLDMSTSMDGAKLTATRAMALHLSEAIDGAGAKVAVLGFGDPVGHRPGQGCILHILKGFDEPVSKAADRIASYPNPYGTPLSPGIIAASRWMPGQISADRYLLGVLTDGGCGYGPRCTQAALRCAVASGVEPFGLGVLQDVSHAFRGFPHANVMATQDLGKVAMRSLVGQLRQAQAI